MKKSLEPIYNRKARHLYEITEKIEAGIELLGSEVKSIRKRDVDFTDAFIVIENGEAWLHNMHIGAWKQAAQFNHEPKRRRRLLLKKLEILKLHDRARLSGLTIVPISIYEKFKCRRFKIEIGVGRGKNLFDKRESIKARDLKRDQERE